MNDKTSENKLETELTALLNKHSIENGSDTPDFILAQYLLRCIDNLNRTISRREDWYGRKMKNSFEKIEDCICDSCADEDEKIKEIAEKNYKLGYLDKFYELRDLLIQADSHLSILRHRGVQKWGLNIPSASEIDSTIGKLRKSYENT